MSLLALILWASPAHNFPMLLLPYVFIQRLLPTVCFWECSGLFIVIGRQYFHLFCLSFTLVPMPILPRSECPSLNFSLFGSFLCERQLLLCYIQKYWKYPPQKHSLSLTHVCNRSKSKKRINAAEYCLNLSSLEITFLSVLWRLDLEVCRFWFCGVNSRSFLGENFPLTL